MNVEACFERKIVDVSGSYGRLRVKLCMVMNYMEQGS